MNSFTSGGVDKKKGGQNRFRKETAGKSPSVLDNLHVQ